MPPKMCRIQLPVVVLLPIIVHKTVAHSRIARHGRELRVKAGPWAGVGCDAALRECVIIGEHILLTVLGVDGSAVKVGVAAPKNVPADRGEIYQRIRRAHDIGAESLVSEGEKRE